MTDADDVLAVWLVAFDPGETTGWATFNKKGQPLGAGVAKSREEVYDLLGELGKVAYVIIEDYRLFQHKAVQQSGSKLETVRVIGAIESWAHSHKSKVILQPASIKKIAELWSGVKPKGAHKNSHHVDAYNHGYYFLQKNNVIKPVKR